MTKTPFLKAAREAFHARLLESQVLCTTSRKKPKKNFPLQYPSNADKDSPTSVRLAQAIFDQIQSGARVAERLAGQISGNKFEQITQSFVRETFSVLDDLRPGKWEFNPKHKRIYAFEQYSHLAEIQKAAKKHRELAVLLGKDYVIGPDVLIVRHPEPDERINAKMLLVDSTVASRASIRSCNNPLPILHASISCKWTLRSDRAQNARSESLNLIRNRKGRLPHIAVVTGEPMPSRLASLALGTGDIDCVYHFALPELIAAVEDLGVDGLVDQIRIMVDGRRLRDISDLPLDLAI